MPVHSATRWPTTRPSKNPPPAQNSQLAGRFRSVWQVLGSNQRRLSRRFYSPSLLPNPMPLTSTYAVQGSIPGHARPLCVRGQRARSTDGGGKTHGPGGGNGHADRRPGFVPLTWHFRVPGLPSSPSSPDSGWAPPHLAAAGLCSTEADVFIADLATPPGSPDPALAAKRRVRGRPRSSRCPRPARRTGRRQRTGQRLSRWPAAPSAVQVRRRSVECARRQTGRLRCNLRREPRARSASRVLPHPRISCGRHASTLGLGGCNDRTAGIVPKHYDEGRAKDINSVFDAA